MSHMTLPRINVCNTVQQRCGVQHFEKDVVHVSISIEWLWLPKLKHVCFVIDASLLCVSVDNSVSLKIKPSSTYLKPTRRFVLIKYCGAVEQVAFVATGGTGLNTFGCRRWSEFRGR